MPIATERSSRVCERTCWSRPCAAWRPIKATHGQPQCPQVARTQALCWLLDELFYAEEDLLALAARPESLSGWRREWLGEFCQRMGAALLAE